MSSNFGRIRPQTAESAALAHLEKSPKTYNGTNVVGTYVLVSLTTIKSPMSWKFDQILPLTAELGAIYCLKMDICVVAT